MFKQQIRANYSKCKYFFIEQGELEVSFSPYIFDHTGFHKFPEYYPQLIVDDGGYCDATGEHCMDEKLLAFLAE